MTTYVIIAFSEKLISHYLYSIYDSREKAFVRFSELEKLSTKVTDEVCCDGF